MHVTGTEIKVAKRDYIKESFKYNMCGMTSNK